MILQLCATIVDLNFRLLFWHLFRKQFFQVLRLERRRDDELYYLRDAPLQYRLSMYSLVNQFSSVRKDWSFVWYFKTEVMFPPPKHGAFWHGAWNFAWGISSSSQWSRCQLRRRKSWQSNSINIHSCSPEPKALVEKVGEFANPPWWLQVLNIHIYVDSVHSVRVEVMPIFTVYLEICSLLRDLSGAFKGLSSFFPFRNNIIMDWYWCTGHLLRTPLPGTSKPWNMISWGTTGLCLVYLDNLAIITFTY